MKRPGSLILVVDFGGGTLDLSLVRTVAATNGQKALRAEVLAKSDAYVGGIDLIPADRSLFKVAEFLSSSGTGAFILKLRLQSKLFDYVLVDVQPSRSQICLTAVGATDFVVVPIEAETKGLNSLIDTLDFLQEQSELMAFTGKVLGILPFRDRWVGLNQTKESKDNIETMQEFAGEIPILPSIKESEQFKRSLRQGQLLSTIRYPDLQHPFEKIVEALSDE